MTASPNRAAVSEMDEARLTKLLDELAAAKAKAAEAEARLTAFCRAWSKAHGYGCHLTPEQVLREFGARRR